jgi:hypothetical protein
MNVYFILWRSRLLFKFNKNIKEFSPNFSTVRSVILELENPSFIFAIHCITLMQQISIGLIQFPNTFFPTIFRDCNNLQMLNFLLYHCNTTFICYGTLASWSPLYARLKEPLVSILLHIWLLKLLLKLAKLEALVQNSALENMLHLLSCICIFLLF